MRRILLLLPTIMAAVSLSAGAVEYRAVDLGSVRQFSAGYCINECGQILGVNRMLNPDGTVVDFTALTGQTNTSALALNNEGVVALYVYGHAYRWSAAAGLAPVVDLAGASNSCPTGMNRFGDITGVSVTDGQHGVVWYADGRVRDLGYGSAADMNDLGQVAGNSYAAGYVIWNPDGTATSLGTMSPKKMNSGGQVAGNVWVGSGKTRGAVWTGGSSVSLLPPSGQSSYGLGINDLGQVVGWGGDVYHQAILWDQHGRATYLETLTGCDFSEAHSINSQGQIVGYSLNTGTGECRLTLWQPVPEPSSILALLAGLGGLGGMIWRRRGW